jgi:ribosomal protein S12 methylthiotransferase accessory factor
MHFSEKQFATRAVWNEEQSGSFQSVPDPYDDEPIAWSPVRSLSTGEAHFVPSSFIYFDFTGEGHRFCEGDSNGLAGGNCLEEAILQGFLEVVERDAIALWWYNRAPRPGIDLTGMSDAWVEEVLAFYASLDRTIWALDLTTDLRIPTFAALSAKRPRSGDHKPGDDVLGEDIIFGFGAHLDAGIALTRAVTEVNQMLPSVLQDPEARRRQLLPDFEDAVEWWETATLEGHAYLRPAQGVPPRSVADYGTPHTTDLRDDVEYCVARAKAIGSDVLVHDLTRADVGLAVTKVIVPNLRHFWRRLGPGRLYEVPVELGWIQRCTAERDMNSISMFV